MPASMNSSYFSKVLKKLSTMTSNWYSSSQSEPLVTVSEGELKGLIETLLDGSPYYSFKGIPFAAPPVGKLRFTAPQPPQPWQGIRDATKYGQICSQMNYNYSTVGSEDCLFLNVYSRTIDGEAKKPVMVYIHGGAYLEGSGSDEDLGPEFLLQHDVILVTLNYRLEMLGFLSLDIPEVPGNAGMKDQVAALKWVKKNIRKFGGDPDNITLFGESAGSSSVTHHLLSPMSKGLFEKAIAQSGVAIADWALGQGMIERAFRAGKVLGKDTNDTAELLEFLRSLPADTLLNITFITLTDDELHRGLKIHFAPVVEKTFEHVEAFLTQKPLEILEQNKANKIPLMIGYTSAEFLSNNKEDLDRNNFTFTHPQYMVPREVVKQVTEEKVKEIGENMKDYYARDSEFNNNTIIGMVNLLSDLHFVYSTHRFVHFYSLSQEPIYMYRFNLDTDLNLNKKYFEASGLEGTCHADDIFYIFHGEQNHEIYKSLKKLQDIVYKVTKLWTDFAKAGNPTPEGSTVQWPKYNEKKYVLNIEEPFSAGEFAEKARVQFMDKIYCEVGLPCIGEKKP